MKKLQKAVNVDDDFIGSVQDLRKIAKIPDAASFGKFKECDCCYIINDCRRKTDTGSMVVLVKDSKILDIFGPVGKIYITCERTHGETIYLQFIAKNKFKVKHPYFKLALSYLKGCVQIEPRNIFKPEFLYEK